MSLLIAGATCLALAACGGDTETAATSPQANVPAETAPAVSDDETTVTTPSESDGGPPAETDPSAPTTEVTPPAGGSGADEPDRPAGPKRKGRAEGSGSSSDTAKRSWKSSGGSSQESAPATPQVPKVLRDYAKGGALATKDEAAAVRDTMLGFQDALVAQDAAKACSYTLGLPAKSDPDRPSPSCEALITGSKMAPPTDRDREMIRAAKITVNGDRASIEMGGEGIPMPFRNVDGRWRIDYGTLLGIGGSGG